MSDRIVVMKDGAIVQEGSPCEIYQQPNSLFSAQFIGETILFSGKVEAANGDRCRVNAGELLLHCAASRDYESVNPYRSVFARKESSLGVSRMKDGTIGCKVILSMLFLRVQLCFIR